MSNQTETEAIGRANCRGYCYACPNPIEVGGMWRRERVGNEVPHVFRLVHHPACPEVERVAPVRAALAAERGADA